MCQCLCKPDTYALIITYKQFGARWSRWIVSKYISYWHKLNSVWSDEKNIPSWRFHTENTRCEGAGRISNHPIYYFPCMADIVQSYNVHIILTSFSLIRSNIILYMCTSDNREQNTKATQRQTQAGGQGITGARQWPRMTYFLTK